MPRPKKKSAPRSRELHRPAEHAFFGALAPAASAGATLPLGSAAVELGDVQMQVDCHRCLLDAMTDHFPIMRSEIGSRTVPSQPPIGADSQGWGICLASFGEYLRQLRQSYMFYVHKPRYTVETIDQPFSDTVLYLKQKALAQISGDDE